MIAALTRNGEPTQADFTRRITRLMIEKLLLEVPSTDSDLLSDGLLDSFSMVQLLLHLEEEFNVTIPLDQLEIEDLRSVDSITRMVQQRSQ
jgi:acyl carrier protein